MIRAFSLALCSAATLSACATTSFAPPGVDVTYRGVDAPPAGCGKAGQRLAIRINEDVPGAFSYINAHATAYDCSASNAANGRQLFEVPAFLSTTAAATAAALGTGPTVGIIGQTGNALFNAGKGYYDPKTKAAVYRDALDALGCIRSEASGISSKVQQVAAIEGQANATFKMAGDPPTSPMGKIDFPVDRQYFNMVKSVVDQVRDILADRLSNVGAPLDSAAMAARIKEIAAEIAAAEAAKNEKEGETPTPPPTDPTQKGLLEASAAAFVMKQQHTVQLDLAVLKPKLDDCVVRART